VQQLKEVVELEPKDKLSAALVKELTPDDVAPGGGRPEPGTGGPWGDCAPGRQLHFGRAQK
jgi:hypothetical protein